MRRLMSPRWLAVHVLVLAAVAVMLGLGWWQIGRARQGNALSFGYALEWPAFAIFAVLVWVRAMRDSVYPERRKSKDAPLDRPVLVPHAERRPVTVVPLADEDDPETVEYNRYLAWLNANPGKRPGDYPG